MSGAEGIAIVGTGPAGLAAARFYRQAGGTGRVTLVGEEEHLPYRRPPLTKEYLRGEIERSRLFIEERQWFESHGVGLRLGRAVEAIDPERGEIHLAGGEVLEARGCVLATGSEPVRPPVAGAEHPDVLLIRRLADSERLAARAAAGTRVTVIGSGFIGCEAAASLAAVGARVTMVSAEEAPQAERLGEYAARRIAGWLTAAGVEPIFGADVAAIDDARRVVLAGTGPVDGEVVVLAAGAAPRAELAEKCGLTLHGDAVCVDSALRASHDFVRAAGDVAFALNATAGRRLRVEHWGDALGQGEIAGRAWAGEDARWDDVPGFWSTIGERTMKYAAWGDGFDEERVEEFDDGAFTIWYSRDDVAVGVLTHERDDDYERGRELIARGGRL